MVLTRVSLLAPSTTALTGPLIPRSLLLFSGKYIGPKNVFDQKGLSDLAYFLGELHFYHWKVTIYVMMLSKQKEDFEEH